MHALPRFAIAALAGIAACGAPTANAERLNGTFPLVSVNDRAVPYDDGAVPPRPGLDANCRILLVRGRLTLDAETRGFSLSYDFLESCSGRELGTSGSTGTFAQSGARLSLTSDLGEGKTDTRPGTVGASRIRVEDRFYLFEFER
jgi:hypothetical protein